MKDELLPCPFCGAELGEPSAVQYPKLGLARLHPGSVHDDICPISGWGFYDEQLAAWNTRTALQAEAAPVADKLERALRERDQAVEALRVIKSEAERENGSWAHLKRCIAAQARATLASIEGAGHEG